MNNPNLKKFYQNSPKPVNYLPNVLVDDDPSYPPLMSGLMQINPETKDIWISAGKELVSDWINITGGSTPVVVPQTIVLTADTSKSSSSVPSRYEYSDVTGLSFPVVAGRTYIYRFVMYFNIVSTNPLVPATGIGTGWAVNGTNTFSNLRLTALFSGTSTASLTPVPQTTYDEADNTGNTAQATLGGTAIIEGTVTPTSNGIFSARYKTDPALFAGITIVVRQGSSVTYTSVP
jgi:hypothetical protein